MRFGLKIQRKQSDGTQLMARTRSTRLLVACLLLTGCSPMMIYPLLTATQAAQQQASYQQAQPPPQGKTPGQNEYEEQQRRAEEQARQNAAQYQAAIDKMEAEKKRQIEAAMAQGEQSRVAEKTANDQRLQAAYRRLHERQDEEKGSAETGAPPPAVVFASTEPIITVTETLENEETKPSEVAPEPHEVVKAEPHRLTAAERKSIAEKKAVRETKRAEQKAKKEAESKALDQIVEKTTAEYCGDPPVRSAWDGTYSELKRLYKDDADDPDSVDFVGCTEPEKRGPPLCWLIVCRLRENNRFGAKILLTKAFQKNTRGWRDLGTK